MLPARHVAAAARINCSQRPSPGVRTPAANAQCARQGGDVGGKDSGHMVTFKQDGLAATVLDDVLWDGLRAELRGALILPHDASYDTERRIFNGMIDRHPAAIAQVAGTDDVVAAVTFARDH